MTPYDPWDDVDEDDEDVRQEQDNYYVTDQMSEMYDNEGDTDDV